MPYNQNDIMPALNQAVAGVPSPEGKPYSNAQLKAINDAFSKLEAFRIWLRLKLDNNSRYDLPNDFDKTKELQAALRFIALMKLNADGTADACESNFYFAQDNKGNDFPSPVIAGQFIDKNLQGGSVANNNDAIEAIRLQTSNENLGNYADEFLNDINLFINNPNGLAQITTDQTEQQNIREQLAILNDPTPSAALNAEYIKANNLPTYLTPADRATVQASLVKPVNLGNRLANFLFYGFAFSVFFPWSFIAFGAIGAWKSFENAFALDEESMNNRPYGRRVDDLFEGRNYPEGLILFLKVPGLIVDTFTAAFFETLRLVFSYDDWSPANQNFFDRVEGAVFNFFYSPITLIAGFAEAAIQFGKNIFNVDFTETASLNAFLDDPNNSPYGLAAARGLRWVGERFSWLTHWDSNESVAIKSAKVLLNLAFFLPLTAVYRGLGAIFGEDALDAGLKTVAKWTILPLLTLAFLPVDFVVGGLASLGRAFGITVTLEGEKKLHNFFASVWAGFWVTTVIGPTVLIPLLATTASILVPAFNLLLAPFKVPLLSPADIWHAVNTVSGQGLWNTFWGHTVNGVYEPGIFAKGLEGFGKGMAAMGKGFANPERWANIGQAFTAFRSTALFTQFSQYTWGVVMYLGLALTGYRAYQEQKQPVAQQNNVTWLDSLANGFLTTFGLKSAQPVVAVAQGQAALTTTQAKVHKLEELNPAPKYKEEPVKVEKVVVAPSASNTTNSPYLPTQDQGKGNSQVQNPSSKNVKPTNTKPSSF